MTDRQAALTDLLLRLSCRPGLIDQWEHIKSEHERPSDTMREGKAPAPSLRGKTLEGGSGVAVAFIEGECVALGLIRMWGHVGETREGREKDEEVLSGERVGLKAMCVRGMRGRRRWFGRNKGPQTTLGFLGSLNQSLRRASRADVRPSTRRAHPAVFLGSPTGRRESESRAPLRRLERAYDRVSKEGKLSSRRGC